MKAKKKRVLFVCLGNSCRSQMAEALARTYGSDVLIASSAGIMPAAIVAPLTVQVLAEKNILTNEQFPKSLQIMIREPFDVVVNMSGIPITVPATAGIVNWTVRDPIGETMEVYRAVVNEIEGLVVRLILDLRGSALQKMRDLRKSERW